MIVPADRYDPVLDRIPKFLSQAGFVLLAFFCFLSPPFVSLASVLLLIAFIWNFRAAVTDILKSFPGKMLLIFICYLAVNTLSGIMRFGYASSQFEQSLDYLYLMLFVIPGWLAYRYEVNWRYIFIIWIFGILVSIGHSLSSGEYVHLYAGRFTMNNSVHPIQTALYFSVAVIGLLLAFFGRSRKKNLPFQVGVVLTLSIISYFFLLANSRGPLIGLVLSFLALVAMWYLTNSTLQKQKKIQILIISLLVIIAVVASVWQIQSIRSHFLKDSGVYEQLLQGDVDNVPYTSAGTRINMWKFGLGEFAESPIVGYGPYIKHLIDHSSLKVKYGHLHNVYLEILLRFGLVGFVLLGIMVLWMSWVIWKKYKDNSTDSNREILMFVIAASVSIGVWAMIDYRLTSWENTAFFWLFLGMQFSQVMINQSSRARADQ